MKQGYQVADRRDSRALSEFLSREGHVLLPLLEWIEKAELAVEELASTTAARRRFPSTRSNAS